MIGSILTGVVALIHLYILVLEMVLWDTPRGRKAFGTTEAFAKESKVLEIPNMAPLLCVRTLNHRDGEINATEYSVSLTRADMIEFTMEH